jgi:hypothetical protein
MKGFIRKRYLEVRSLHSTEETEENSSISVVIACGPTEWNWISYKYEAGMLTTRHRRCP